MLSLPEYPKLPLPDTRYEHLSAASTAASNPEFGQERHRNENDLYGVFNYHQELGHLLLLLHQGQRPESQCLSRRKEIL